MDLEDSVNSSMVKMITCTDMQIDLGQFIPYVS